MSHRNVKHILPKNGLFFHIYACTYLKGPYINKCQCTFSSYSCHLIQRQIFYLIPVLRNASLSNYHCPNPGINHFSTLAWAPMLTVFPLFHWALLRSISNQHQSNSLKIQARSHDF